MRAAFDAAGLSEACGACSYRIENDLAGTGQDGGDGVDTGSKKTFFDRDRDSLFADGEGGGGDGEGNPFDAFAASIAQQEDNESKSNGLGAVSPRHCMLWSKIYFTKRELFS